MFNPRIEKISRQKLQELQLKNLKKVVKNVYENVPFYKKKFKDLKITPDDIKTLDDITKLPLTTKDVLRENAPFGMMATSLDNCIELHSSSGTTGIPVTVCYTTNDIKVWSEVMARCLSMSGLTKKDIFQNPIPYGTFTGAFGFHYGAQKVGALVVPSGLGQSERQLKLMDYYGTTFISGVASYVLRLAQVAQEIGVDLKKLKVKNGLFGAEMFTSGLKKRIIDTWDIDVYDIYGLTEMCGPGVSTDCDQHNGLHIWEDHFLVEIINPATGEPQPYGSEGELVITTLTKEAQPVIRFRTRDITSLNPEVCDCGRTMVRMSRITGRSDDMLIVRGVNVFPSQIESVLLEVEGVEPHYLIVVDRQDSFKFDELEIWVEVSEDVFSDEMQKMENLEKRLRSEMDSVLGISARIKLVEPRTIARTEGKAKRVVDRSEI
jgi:phenylacetate-CoA ligase